MYMTKLTQIGNPASLTLSPEQLAEAGLGHGDAVSISVTDGRIEIARAAGADVESLNLGRQFARRYKRSMALLAR